MYNKHTCMNTHTHTLTTGDFAYNFDSDNGTVGDNFMRDISPLASHVPYMVSNGNHERFYNYSHYTERFRGMPVNGNEQNVPNGQVWTYAGIAPNNWYYSWNVGLIHFITISTEIYYNFPWLADDQYNWLIQDLTIANNNRTHAPWIIVNGHRPLYCSDAGRCHSDSRLIRNGLEMNGTIIYGLEDVFYKYGVDFYICGHEHNYERMYDIYKNKTSQSVTNMPATTYIITGAAGSDENHQPFNGSEQIWDAFRTQAYSYTRFYVYNSSHIELQQVVSDNTLPSNYSGYIIDHTWYVQNNHGPFGDNYFQYNYDKEKSISGNNNAVRQETFDVFEIANDGSAIKYKESHKHRRRKERRKDMQTRIKYLGNDKEMYRGVRGVYF